MLGLLFAGAKRNFEKIKLHFTISCFLYQKKATVPNAEFKASVICVVLCKRCLQMKIRTRVVKKYDLFYLN